VADLRERKLSAIDQDMRPPFSVEIEKDRISICNSNHVIAVMWLADKHAKPLAEFIVSACNGAKP